MDRYNISDTAPKQNPLDNERLPVPRSAFNLSRVHMMNAMYGMIHVADCFEVLPNSHVKLNLNMLLKTRNPLVRNMYSGARIYAQAFYNRMSDLWEGAQRFIDKGRSGSIEMNKPTLIHEFTKSAKDYSTFTPMSISDQIGIPIEYYDSTNPLTAYKATEATQDNKVNNNYTGNIDALPFVMYARLYRDYFMNQNLLQDNKSIFPDNEDLFILPYNCEEASVLDYNNPDMSLGEYEITADGNMYVPTADSNLPLPLNAPFFRQSKGDYFNTASPFADLIRGTTPSISITTTSANIDWDDVFGDTESISPGKTYYSNNPLLGFYGNNATEEYTLHGIVKENGETNYTYNVSNDTIYKNALEKAKVNIELNGTINLNDLRALETYTLFMERNARTQGDYDSLIEAQYNYNPHSDSSKGIRIGSAYQDIAFTEVTSTNAGGDAPLGTMASKGISNGSMYLGDFDAPDYGYIMVLYQIVPDNYYTQGVPRWLTEINQSEVYFPLLNNLAPMAIKNKELFVSGDSDIDEDVFGYQERYADKKSRRNMVTGLMSLNHDVADFDASSVMARRFTETPALNNQFVTLSPQNIDMSVFSVSDEPPFDVSLGNIVDYVAPMPFKSIPGGLSARG